MVKILNEDKPNVDINTGYYGIGCYDNFRHNGYKFCATWNVLNKINCSYNICFH